MQLMPTESPEQQLELFHVEGHRSTQSSQRVPGLFVVRIRHDQVFLGSIACLLGISVVFACGVERGKELARSERTMLIPRGFAEGTPTTVAQEEPRPRSPIPALAIAKNSQTTYTVGPSTPRRIAENGTLAAGLRYAIQVVTYSRERLATRELQRLQAKGERAFLVKRSGRTIVYVGPFPSQAHASRKLTTLKTFYVDCFIKTL